MLGQKPQQGQHPPAIRHAKLGRPRKNPLAPTSRPVPVQPLGQGEEEVPVRRKRGRPRKNPPPGVEQEQQQPPQSSAKLGLPVKRKRGRPRKTPMPFPEGAEAHQVKSEQEAVQGVTTGTDPYVRDKGAGQETQVRYLGVVVLNAVCDTNTGQTNVLLLWNRSVNPINP